MGRFISEDPAADPNNPNLYAYGRNNPLRFFDPSGLFTEEGKVELDIDINVDVNVNIPEIQLDKEINLDTTPVTVGKYGVVTEGDSLWDIAKREYGDPNLYPILQKVNNIEDPAKLQVGQRLFIPDIHQMSFTSKDGSTITSYSYVTFATETLLKGIQDKSVIKKNVTINAENALFVREFHEGRGYKNNYLTLNKTMVATNTGKGINVETIIWGVLEIAMGIESGAKAISIAYQSGNPWLTLQYGAQAIILSSVGLSDVISGFYGEETLGMRIQKDPHAQELLKYVPLTELPSPPIWRKETWPIPE